MMIKMKMVALFVIITIMSLSFTSCVAANSNSKFNAYVDNLEILKNQMLNDCAEAETICNLVVKVWSNAIYQKSDPKTDKYTKKGNKFVDDFNIALDTLYADPDIRAKISTLKSNQEKIRLIIKDMYNPPKDLEQCYNTLSEYYITYKAFVDLAINPTGSLNDFSDEFDKKDNAAMDIYEKLNIQIPNKK